MRITPLLISGIGSSTRAVIESMAKHRDVLEPERIGEAPLISNFIEFLITYEEQHPDHDDNLENCQLDASQRAAVYSEMLCRMQYGLTEIPRDETKKYWIAKGNLSRNGFRRATDVFGRLAVIHVMRNGVEVVNAARRLEEFAHLDFAQLCEHWRRNIDASRHLHDSEHCAVVRHHELMENPHKVYDEVMSRLGMAHDDTPADFISGNPINSSCSEGGRMEGTSGAFDDGLAGWHAWTREEQKVFIDICDPIMQEFGFERPYAASLKHAPPPSLLAKDPTVISPTLKELAADNMRPDLVNYLVNISLKHGYAYIENPTVASTLLLEALQEEEQGFPLPANTNIHDITRSPLKHPTAYVDEFQKRVLFSDEFRRFTMVRNPYTRLLSAYLSKIAPGWPSPARKIILAQLKGVSPEEITDATETVDFRTFVEVVCNQQPVAMDPHWRPQNLQLMIRDIEYDYIGRFENLEESLDYIGKHFAQTELRAKAAGHSDFGGASVGDMYDQSLLDLVYRTFYDDFQAFGYAQQETRELCGLTHPGDLETHDSRNERSQMIRHELYPAETFDFGSRNRQDRPLYDPHTMATNDMYGAWVAEVANATVFVESDIILIYDADGVMVEEISHILPETDPEKERADERYKDTIHIDGTLALFPSRYPSCFYHWLIDSLPGYLMLDRFGMLSDPKPELYIHRAGPGFQSQSLADLGFEFDHVHTFFDTRDPKTWRPATYHVKRLLVPMFRGPETGWTNRGVLKDLREVMLDHLPSEPHRFWLEHDGPRRLYIPRGSGARRQVLNEDELLPALADAGYATASMQPYTMLEQAHIFRDAEHVLSPHGSALGNVIFCSPGTMVSEFAGNYLADHMRVLSTYFDLDYDVVAAGIDDNGKPLELLYDERSTDTLVDIGMIMTMAKRLPTGSSEQSGPIGHAA